MTFDKNLARGIGIGVGLAYLFDPRGGNRRRAILRDQLRHNALALLRLLAKSSRDFNHRARGKIIETRSRFVVEHVPDEILVERVRSKIGRVVSHPHAIGVQARNGCITVTGAIFRDQVTDLLNCVSRVRGVSSVKSGLEIHALDEQVPTLQGQHRTRRQPRWLAGSWLVSAGVISLLVGSEIFFTRRRNMYASALSAIALGFFVKGFEVPRGLRSMKRAEKMDEERQSLLDPLTTVRMTTHH